MASGDHVIWQGTAALVLDALVTPPTRLMMVLTHTTASDFRPSHTLLFIWNVFPTYLISPMCPKISTNCAQAVAPFEAFSSSLPSAQSLSQPTPRQSEPCSAPFLPHVSVTCILICLDGLWCVFCEGRNGILYFSDSPAPCLLYAAGAPLLTGSPSSAVNCFTASKPSGKCVLAGPEIGTQADQKLSSRLFLLLYFFFFLAVSHGLWDFSSQTRD